MPDHNPAAPATHVDLTGSVGVQVGEHNELHIHQEGPVVRSAYRRQVERIAPAVLLGRDAELAELADWCTSAAVASPYLRWRAPAWYGKSALLSWFVLHPPVDVRLLSFFVTARLSGQSNKTNFAEVVLEQLVELLDRPLPVLLTDATRDAHLHDLLCDAARWCRERGSRLVLVVDGLDEDRGVTSGPDAHSIAALLPAHPPAGMRIIVSGRPDPPIPTDVPDDHPLRDTATVRLLARSERADVVRQDAERELRRLLFGGQVDRDLLSFIAAAGGGLSSADLAELVGCAPYEVDTRLSAVAGRTFHSRSAHFAPDGPVIYLLAHEQLQVQALAKLGPTVTGYRDRLHRWAESYRSRGWPPGTPEYLLRGYFTLLRTTGDVQRLVVCAVDVARHDRMLDMIGGDTAALVELTTVQKILLAGPEPDLAVMFRLARHHANLLARNEDIPCGLPAVWARLGNHARAEALAMTLPDADRRAEAMALLSAATVDIDPERAERIAMSALAEPCRGDTAWLRQSAIATLAQRDLWDQVDAWINARSGTDQAYALVASAFAVAPSSADRAESMLTEAMRLGQDITEDNVSADVMSSVATGLATAGHIDQALEIASTVADLHGDWHNWHLGELYAAAAERSIDPKALALAAESWASSVPEHRRSDARRDSAIVWAAAGQHDRALIIASDLARTPSVNVVGRFLRAMTRAVRSSSVEVPTTLNRMADIALTLWWKAELVDSLADISTSLVVVGDVERARFLLTGAAAVVDEVMPMLRPASRVDLAAAAAALGDLQLAESQATAAEIEARLSTATHVSIDTINTILGAGGTDQGLALAWSISERTERLTALTCCVRTLVVTDCAKARVLANIIVAEAETVDGCPARTLSRLAAAAAASLVGDPIDVDELHQILASSGYYGSLERIVGDKLVDLLSSADTLEIARHASLTVADRSSLAAREIIKLAVTGPVVDDWCRDEDNRAAADHVLCGYDAPAEDYELIAEVLSDMAADALTSGDLDEAHEIATSLMTGWERWEFFIEVGRVALAAGNFSLALDIVSEACAFAPHLARWEDDAALLAEVAKLAAEAGKLDDACAIAAEVRDRLDQALARAYISRTTGSLDEAVSTLAAALIHSPAAWPTVLAELADIRSDAVLAVADELVADLSSSM